MIYDGAKFKIYKYGGVWYGYCPHCATVRYGKWWWQVREYLRIHAAEHPVDKGH